MNRIRNPGWLHPPKRILEMMTVKAGAELLTVSVKLTATYWSATRPSSTVVNLIPPTTTMCLSTRNMYGR